MVLMVGAGTDAAAVAHGAAHAPFVSNTAALWALNAALATTFLAGHVSSSSSDSTRHSRRRRAALSPRECQDLGRNTVTPGVCAVTTFRDEAACLEHPYRNRVVREGQRLYALQTQPAFTDIHCDRQ